MSQFTMAALVLASLAMGAAALRYGLRGLIKDFKIAKRMGERDGLHDSR